MQFNLNAKEKEKSRVYLTCIWHLMGMCCYHRSALGLFVPTSSGSRQGIVKWFQFMIEMGTTSWPKRKWKILRYISDIPDVTLSLHGHTRKMDGSYVCVGTNI